MTSYAFLLLAQFAIAQVGIGTTSPSPGAALDVTSADRGILLPRLNDTLNVSAPTAGLLIYNMNANAPAYHDGTRWNSMAAMSMPSLSDTDSITYTITGATEGFTNGTYSSIQSFSNGASAGSSSSFIQDLSFTKYTDVNSIPFAKAVIGLTALTGMAIEFNVFLPNTATPRYSIKLTSIAPTSFNLSVSNTDLNIYEQISLTAAIFGYKDWVSGNSFAWNLAMGQFESY